MTTSSKPTILGIAGTNGAGKDSVGDMLAERHNFLVVSASDLLREEAKKRGLSIERHNLRAISTEWRKEGGLGAIIDRAKALFDKGGYSGLAVTSLRNPGEPDRIHELGGQVVWVDADPKIRYDRITSRSRSTEDQKTFEEFQAEEKAEMEHSGDDNGLHMSAVRDRSDVFMENNGNDLEAFKDQAEKELGYK